MGPEEFNWSDADGKFAQQMCSAGVTPLHRIALAVSGGADSMALCLLAARWRGGREKAGESAGLIGFVVDHSLRSGSAEESNLVKQWVCKLGLSCEILKCVWVDGTPALGHLQDAARNARYALLAQACEHRGVEVLLTAHHADDQAELFVLRLSRCSGIAGLAGMASATYLYPVFSPSAMKSPSSCPLLLIRPLLKFVKEELYNICQQSGHEWVEDPTNLNLSFARNRIRKALKEPSFRLIRKDIQELIAFCRKSRSILDSDRDLLLSEVALVSQEWGHVSIDVEKLVASGASDAVQHRVVAALLQFVAQKSKPPRGRAVSSVLERLRAKLPKGAYTVGGCNIFRMPCSKGSRASICLSPDSPVPSRLSRVCLTRSGQLLSMESSHTFRRVPSLLVRKDLCGVGYPILNEQESGLTSKAIAMLALDVKTPRTVISEFQALGLVSEVGASSLQDLACELSRDMGKQSDKQLEGSVKSNLTSTVSAAMKEKILFGEYRHFMDRFVVSLSSREKELLPNSGSSKFESKSETPQRYCCLLREKPALWIRHFEEKDQAYLSRIAKGNPDLEETRGSNLDTDVMSHDSRRQYLTYRRCDNERISKAKEALVQLQRVPKLVRRGLPVLVTAQGLLVGMPTLGFGHCPLVSVTAIFCPRSPLSASQAAWH